MTSRHLINLVTTFSLPYCIAIEMDNTAASSNSPSPFLRLPRELRDEIYKQLLVFITPQPTRVPTLTPNIADYEYKRSESAVDLTILRVSKQIHDEAAAVYYGCNTFPLCMVIMSRKQPRCYEEYLSSNSGHVPMSDSFNVRFDALWERLQYHCREDTLGIHKVADFDSPKPNHELKPAARYRALVRRVHIDIIDIRADTFHREVHPLNKAGRKKLRKVLLPLIYRLRTSFGDAGSKLNMAIKLTPSQCGWLLHSKAERSPNVDSSSVDLDFYRQMIETIWPLTTGPWRWHLDIPDELLTRFPGVAERVLDVCTWFTTITEREIGYYKSMEVSRNYNQIIGDIEGAYGAIDEDTSEDLVAKCREVEKRRTCT
ncbi:hypothetical protein ABW21_db0205089 [Orbilia brochopaga]|nr:hypothetical protein ABW21_db0205089 [Drechslerella brochopaga]